MIWNAEDGTRTRTGLSTQKISAALHRLLTPSCVFLPCQNASPRGSARGMGEEN